MLAFIRTSNWETPLFFHVLGALVLVGALFVVAIALTTAWRTSDDDNAATLTRFGYRTMLYVVLPAFIVMRIGAQWTLSESPFDDNSTWVGIGYVAADLCGVGLLVALVLSGLGLRRSRGTPPRVQVRIVTLVTLGLLAAYLIAIWAMTTKPT
jgi:uncharacterized membrane protein